MKGKYWYITEIETCVLCGYEMKYRYRVPTKPVHSIILKDNACPEHFI